MPTARKKAPPVDDRWMTFPEAARRIGITPFKVRSFALRGVLVTEVSAGRTVISRESVERLARELARKPAGAA